MKYTLLILAAAMGAASCDSAHAHVRAVVHGQNGASVRKTFTAFLQHDEKAKAADVSGKWQMTMDTPHGVSKGPLEIKQDGAKFSATFTSDQMGPMKSTGTVDGKVISFSMEVPGGQGVFGFKGTIDAKKMSGTTEMGGAWSATR